MNPALGNLPGTAVGVGACTAPTFPLVSEQEFEHRGKTFLRGGPGVPPGFGFWRSYDYVLVDLVAAAAERDKQKIMYESTKLWSSTSTHLLGLIGEWRYGLEIGRSPDMSLNVMGDTGTDFDGVDVKACTYMEDPHLKVRHEDFEKGATAYALVLVEERHRRAAYLGWQTAEYMRNAPLWNYGNGPMHYVDWRDLLAFTP